MDRTAPEYQRGRAEALLQVASHLRQYAQASQPPASWWPCVRYRGDGKREVLGQLETFAGQLEAEGRASPKPAAPCGCGGGILGALRRMWK